LTWVQFFKGVGFGGILVWLSMRWNQWFNRRDQYALQDMRYPLQNAVTSYPWLRTTSSLNQENYYFSLDHYR
jgi:hypothetical protein